MLTRYGTSVLTHLLSEFYSTYRVLYSNRSLAVVAVAPAVAATAPVGLASPSEAATLVVLAEDVCTRDACREVGRRIRWYRRPPHRL
jgi:hypothetical protein